LRKPCASDCVLILNGRPSDRQAPEEDQGAPKEDGLICGKALGYFRVFRK
jgi:hypothetical protein